MLVRGALALLVSLMLMTPLSAEVQREPVRILLVGDSTQQPRTGYGVQLCQRFSPEVTCLNRARGGTSTKSYRDIGSWDAAMEIVRDKQNFKATYVFIALGHNDGSSLPARHTELPEYSANLARFVDETRAAGGIPVLFSPVTDRRFREGRLLPGLKPWADRAGQVAREKDVPFIDLFTVSAAAVQEMGIAESDTLAPAPPPPEVVEASRTGTSIGWPRPRPAGTPAPPPPPPGTPAPPPGFDYVHIGAKGAPLFAGMAASLIKMQVPELAPYVLPRPQGQSVP